MLCLTAVWHHGYPRHHVPCSQPGKVNAPLGGGGAHERDGLHDQHTCPAADAVRRSGHWRGGCWARGSAWERSRTRSTGWVSPLYFVTILRCGGKGEGRGGPVCSRVFPASRGCASGCSSRWCSRPASASSRGHRAATASSGPPPARYRGGSVGVLGPRRHRGDRTGVAQPGVLSAGVHRCAGRVRPHVGLCVGRRFDLGRADGRTGVCGLGSGRAPGQLAAAVTSRAEPGRCSRRRGHNGFPRTITQSAPAAAERGRSGAARCCRCKCNEHK